MSVGTEMSVITAPQLSAAPQLDHNLLFCDTHI
jgi:hypothetical protein